MSPSDLAEATFRPVPTQGVSVLRGPSGANSYSLRRSWVGSSCGNLRLLRPYHCSFLSLGESVQSCSLDAPHLLSIS